MTTRAVFWILAAFAALALPFLVLMFGERAPGRGLLWDFSKGLGFGALAAAGMQFALTARFRRMAYPFGIDIVYLFHRYMAIGALALMLGHFGILYVWFEEALGELNPLEARWELTAGRLALVSFALLVLTSEFRKQLGIEYGWWRAIHVGLGEAIGRGIECGMRFRPVDAQRVQIGGQILDQQINRGPLPHYARQIRARYRRGGRKQHSLDPPHPFAPAQLLRQVGQLAVKLGVGSILGHRSDPVEPEGVTASQFAHRPKVNQPVAEPPRCAIRQRQGTGCHRVLCQEDLDGVGRPLGPKLWCNPFQKRSPTREVDSQTRGLNRGCGHSAMTG